MTENVLVQVIFVLCGGTVNTDDNLRVNEVKEIRITCFEDYLNCALKGNTTQILSLKEFKDKCVSKK